MIEVETSELKCAVEVQYGGTATLAHPCQSKRLTLGRWFGRALRGFTAPRLDEPKRRV
jgi:hypothetical protein